MTMQHQIHPDDERLSALAGGDSEATGDAALRAHVEGCDRCTSLVRELGELRVALAQLPDLAPSRPLQLIPPVPEPASAGGGGWLRRLAAPAMAAGAVLAVVGGVGFGASVLGSMAASGGAIFSNVGTEFAGDNGQPGEEAESPATARDALAATPTPHPRAVTGGESAPAPSGYRLRSGAQSPAASAHVAPAEGTGDRGTGDEGAGPDLSLIAIDFDQPGSWLPMMGAGIVLLLLGLLLRNRVQPRAG